MRFHPEGPIIPDDLLEERDRGNVVFFCGAGISIAAGLPDFLGLAEQVVDQLGVPKGGEVWNLFARTLQDPELAPPLDQLFNVLQHEYQAGVVDSIVGNLLKTPRSPDLTNHSIVLRLSRSAGNQAQVVTTNFDLLFERVDKRLRTYVAPELPDLASGQSLQGLVYLHGRRSASSTKIERQGLVLSSSDFGRAYLAQGWATNFVRELLRNYVIVLVGYKANDPPVRYLLEGLHSLGGDQAARIFAFDKGSPDEVAVRWRGRGVRSLAYSDSALPHENLWTTLSRWAARADNSAVWSQSIVEMSRKGPAGLEPYQRGQVASLIHTSQGAKLFADANPAPPAEWLYVFDKNVRSATSIKARIDTDEYQPSEHYGLDDDPAPSADNERKRAGIDLIESLPDDRIENDTKRLIGLAPPIWSNPLPTRLSQLVRWICKLLRDPAALWWASSYQSVHPVLSQQIEWQLERHSSDLPAIARKSWQLLLEAWSHAPADEDGWYNFAPKLRDGWTNFTLREFTRVMMPYLSVEHPFGRRRPCASATTWEDFDAQQLVRFSVKFPHHELATTAIPPDALPKVVRELRICLERASNQLDDLDTQYWQTAAFEEDVDQTDGGERYLSDSDSYLINFVRLFDRLVAENTDAARREALSWISFDKYFFDKLRIHSWSKTNLFSGSEVSQGILHLSDASFWNPYHRRELLRTLGHRWNEFAVSDQVGIEQRILHGPSRFESEVDVDYEKRRAITAATVLGWLMNRNCSISQQTIDSLPTLREADPNWRPSWDESADRTFESRGGSVRVDVDFSKIENVKLRDVLGIAAKETKHAYDDLIEFRPFEGMVQERPLRAYSALAFESRRGSYPKEFWETALSRWPAQVGQRLSCALAHRLVRLPTDVVAALSHYVAGWLCDHLAELSKLDLSVALNLWDSALQKLAAGDVLCGSRTAEASYREPFYYAVGSPAGKMAEALFKLLDALKLKKSVTLPTEFRVRIEKLLRMEEPCSRHVLCQATLRLRWLHFIDPNWVSSELIPAFSIRDSRAEAAWSGYLHDSQLAAPELFEELKPNLLFCLSEMSTWKWSQSPYQRVSEMLVLACYKHLEDKRYISYEQTRLALQQIDDKARAHAIWFLGRVVRANSAWNPFGRDFLKLAWPQEKRYQTPAVARSITLLAMQAENRFPEVVRTTLHLLAPSDQVDMATHSLRQADSHKNSLAGTYPEATVALLDRLIARDASRAPYELASILDQVAESLPKLRQDERWRRLNRLAGRA